MLEQVLGHLKNWFQVGVYPGTYTIQNGEITLPFLVDGQYFRICGSLFSDGLHRYGPDMECLQDETFTGTIWALAVPKAVIDLADEIAVWQEKYGDVITNPYSSESFGGYSYTKATMAEAASGSASAGWEGAFRSRLNRWRKLREI